MLVHKDLANIFMERWNTKNPFVDYDDLTKVTEDVDRILTPQPLVYNDVMYNLRKLHELWFHLLKSGINFGSSICTCIAYLFH